MNRYIIALSCKEYRGDWGDMVRHSKLLTEAGFDMRPAQFFSRDAFEIHWMIQCTEKQLTMVMLKTSAKLVQETEDPWAFSTIPF